MLYPSVSPSETDGLSSETLASCINALRYLQATFKAGCRIDAMDMEKADKALARVEIEQMFQAQKCRFAELSAREFVIASEG